MLRRPSFRSVGKALSDVPLPPRLCMFHSHSGKELTRITTVNPG